VFSFPDIEKMVKSGIRLGCVIAVLVFLLALGLGFYIGSVGHQPKPEQPAKPEIRQVVPPDPSAIIRVMPLGDGPRAQGDSAALVSYLLNSISRGQRVRFCQTDTDGMITFDMYGSGVPQPELKRLMACKTVAELCELFSDAGFYYRCLDFRDREQLLSQMGAGKEVRVGILTNSQVVRNLRYFARYDTVWGWAWESLDFRGALGQGEWLRQVADPKPDSREGMGRLPNGLLAYWACDGKGGLLSHVDVDVAIDHATTGRDKRVVVPLSCMGCHLSLGVREPVSDVDGLLKDKVDAKEIVAGVDQKTSEKIMALFGGHANRSLAEDARDYAASTRRMPPPIAALRALDQYRGKK